MIGVTVLNFLLGSGAKIAAHGIGRYMDFKEKKELLVLNADTDKLRMLQSGEDKADPFTQATRRIIALAFTSAFLYIMYHLTVISPETEFDVQVNRNMSWFWEMIVPFPINEKGIMKVSGGSILWEAWQGLWLILGFYFTRIGKGD